MQLQTPRLDLREFVPSDAALLLEYQSTAAYRRYYPESPNAEDDARALVERFVAWQEEVPRWRYQWAVLLRGSERLIGNCGIRKSATDADEAEIGCELAPEHWGRRYPLEMGRWLLQFGFTELRLHRVYSHCIAGNRGAVALAEALGMKQEGRLRENVKIRGERHDTLIHGILRHEWEAAGG
jgi:RimJ/RimL family protein N-acetyltransferase